MVDRRRHRRSGGSRWGLVPVALTLVVLAGCQTGIGRDPDRARATTEAYETRVARLQRQVDRQRATLAALTPPPPTPTPVPFAKQWRVEITGPVERRDEVGRRDDVTPVAARGDFVVIPIAVTNLTSTPTAFNPAQRLVLVDADGRKYELDPRASGAAYLLDFGLEPAFAARQPGLPYDDVLVFDVPPKAQDLSLVSVDASFSVRLGPIAAGTPLG